MQRGGLEPRSKIIVCLFVLFTILLMDQTHFVGMAYVLLIGIGFLEGISFKTYGKRLLLLLPFLLITSVTMLMGTSARPSDLSFVTNMVLKAMSGLLAVSVMTAGHSPTAIWGAMAQLKVPDVLIAVLFLTTRFAVVLSEKLKRIQKALKARLFNPRLGAGALKIYGEVSGGMILSSFEYGDRVHNAMLARGFDGKMPHTPPGPISPWALLRGLAYGSVFLTLLILEKR